MHTILHIGAGEANNLPQLLLTGAEQITLVEPNPGLAKKLRLRTAQHSQVNVVEAAITSNSANNQLTEYNLPEACGLHPVTGLKNLFPGLKVNATYTVKTLSPDQLLAEYGPQSGQQALLSIEAPGEEHALLETLIKTDQLKQFKELRVNANPTPYFEGSVAAENTLQSLVDYGYQIKVEDEQNPDWPSWELSRDPLVDRNNTLLAENEELRACTKHLEEILKQAQQQKTQAEKQNEQLQQKLRQKRDSISELTKDLASANEKIEAQLGMNTKLDELEKKISSVGSNMTSHLDKKLINTAKRIENKLELQNYFNTGELPLNDNGWSIDTDLALYLAEKLETEDYDLVIEFGSGDSTVLFAKVLMKKMREHKLVDAPKQVLTFEHNKMYYEQSVTMLRHASLENIVNLVHAPLVDYSYEGEDYQYYDCDVALEKLANQYMNKSPNILVLIDGPPADTGINARFPALPKLLNHFSNASFDLILDDYNRMEEKVVAEKWIEIIKNRAIAYSVKHIPLERGTICISIGVSA